MKQATALTALLCTFSARELLRFRQRDEGLTQY